jgi:Flp pilus assembly pilin Flp
MEMVKFYLRKATKGQTMTEYALILAAIAVVAFATYNLLGDQIVIMVQDIIDDLSGAT